MDSLSQSRSVYPWGTCTTSRFGDAFFGYGSWLGLGPQCQSICLVLINNSMNPAYSQCSIVVKVADWLWTANVPVANLVFEGKPSPGIWHWRGWCSIVVRLFSFVDILLPQAYTAYWDEHEYVSEVRDFHFCWARTIISISWDNRLVGSDVNVNFESQLFYLTITPPYSIRVAETKTSDRTSVAIETGLCMSSIQAMDTTFLWYFEHAALFTLISSLTSCRTSVFVALPSISNRVFP